MGICMQNLNVTAGDSRDEHGRGRFFGVVPEQMIVPNLVPKSLWFFGYSYYPVEVVRRHSRLHSSNIKHFDLLILCDTPEPYTLVVV